MGDERTAGREVKESLPFHLVLARHHAGSGGVGGPLGVAYRTRAPEGYVWVLSLSSEAATPERVAGLLAALQVDHALRVFPETILPSRPPGVVLHRDGVLRTVATNDLLAPDTAGEIARVGLELQRLHSDTRSADL